MTERISKIKLWTNPCRGSLLCGGVTFQLIMQVENQMIDTYCRINSPFTNTPIQITIGMQIHFYARNVRKPIQ
ncbi:hypothetical protein D3C71_929860 [compost metagenome]